MAQFLNHFVRPVTAYVLLGVAFFVFSSSAQAQLLTGYKKYREPAVQVFEAERAAPVQRRVVPSDADLKAIVVRRPEPIRSPIRPLLTSPILQEREEKPRPPAVQRLWPVKDKDAESVLPVSAPSSLTAFTPRLLPVAQAQPVRPQPVRAGDAQPVDLQADHMSHDDERGVIVASGNVIIAQGERILRADEIQYNLSEDRVTAIGHVILQEANGDLHSADRVELRDAMKNGFADKVRTYLTDGARFAADTGKREDGVRTVMSRASYTPCEECKEDPTRPPVWQIKASKVTHDTEANKISYKNARFELGGVPVLYTPYFAHPDGTVKRKSGFLNPSGGYKSSLGSFIESSYYWAVAPDRDLTIGTAFYTDENPMVSAEYRQRWADASLIFETSLTHSKRTERKFGGVDVVKDEELRGHLFAEGRWDIDDKWRAGLDIQSASDDPYLRQYDFSSEDVLESQVFVERFDGRDYFSARGIAYQDVRVRTLREDQPNVLPEIIWSEVGDPNAGPVFGGTWRLDTSYLGLRRSGDEQDYDRFSVAANWNKRLVSNHGLLTTIQANARGDLYHSRDLNVATPGSGRSSEGTDFRFFPQAHIKTSYPMQRQFEAYQATIEPIVSFTVAPNIDVNSGIPNEDSQDVQIDASNIFEPDRFPGLDRVEDQSHLTYGLRTGLYGYNGSYGDLFLGQSYRLEKDDNPFPAGSGFDKRQSDLVGQVSTRHKDRYTLDYRFQLASANLASQRHEIDAYADWNRFRVGGRYLFAKELEGTSINESREQLKLDTQYYFNEKWRMHSGGTQDLGANPGLREAYLGLDYFGQCLSWSVTGERNLTDEASGDSSTEIVFRIGLKNLGEFAVSDLRERPLGE